MITFIDDNKAKWGVAPICAQLPIAPSTYYAYKKRPASARSTRDEDLKPKIMRVFKQNYEVYGADKIWAQMNREQVKVARCTVERLMKDLGIQGATRGKSVRTTLPGDSALQLPDLVKRKFYAPAPNRLWVSDLTYVRTHGGFRYVAYVIDVYARMIVGWRVSNSLKTAIALDALEQAIWVRRCGPTELAELIHHSDRGVQYLAIRYTERVAAAGGVTSVGSRGDFYDNALVRHEAPNDRGGMKGPSRRPVAAGRMKLGAAQTWRRRIGWEQPRQSRDGSAPSDGLGPASKTRRCTDEGTNGGTPSSVEPART